MFALTSASLQREFFPNAMHRMIHCSNYSFSWLGPLLWVASVPRKSIVSFSLYLVLGPMVSFKTCMRRRGGEGRGWEGEGRGGEGRGGRGGEGRGGEGGEGRGGEGRDGGYTYCNRYVH